MPNILQGYLDNLVSVGKYSMNFFDKYVQLRGWRRII